jgi:hypothetical protein
VRYIAPDDVVRFAETVPDPMPTGDGSPDSPYDCFVTARIFAPDNARVILEAGSVHELSGADATISKPMTIKGYNVTLRKAD